MNGTAKSQQSYLHTTVFHDILKAKCPPEEKSELRLFHESFGIVAAGIETTTKALVVGMYHLLSQPKLLHRLKEELRSAFSDPDAAPILA